MLIASFQKLMKSVLAERTKAAVIGITESKLDKSIFQSEIQIDNYDLL